MFLLKAKKFGLEIRLDSFSAVRLIRIILCQTRAIALTFRRWSFRRTRKMFRIARCHVIFNSMLIGNFECLAFLNYFFRTGIWRTKYRRAIVSRSLAFSPLRKWCPKRFVFLFFGFFLSNNCVENEFQNLLGKVDLFHSGFKTLTQ